MRFRRTWLILVMAALQIAAITPPRPVEQMPPIPAPDVTAPAWILFDETNGVVLDGVDVDLPRPMASTTKMMTALLAIESGQMDEIVTVSQRAADVGEAEIGLEAGERIPLSMLVHALMIRSGNDAAMAAAEHVGGSVEEFVALMNQRAAELGMTGTTFSNPHGLDAQGHASTPRDLLTLGLAAMEYPEFASMARMNSYRISDAPDGSARIAEATNALLTTYRGAFGVKTGYTFQAGLVIVAAAERDGRRIWAVVMGAEGPGAHFSDAAKLFDHAFEKLRIVDTIGRGTPFRLGTGTLEPEVTALARLHTLSLLARLEPPAETTVEETEPVDAPPEVIAADLPGPADAFRWLYAEVFGG